MTRRRLLVLGSEADYVARLRGGLIAELVAAGWDVEVSAPPTDDGWAALEVARLGARFTPLRLRRNAWSPVADIRLLARLAARWRAERPAAVLAITAKPVVLGGMAAFLAGVPAFHALIPGLGYAFTGRRAGDRLRRRFVTLLYRIALHRARAVVFQNQDDRDEFRRLGIVGARHAAIVVDGSGVDISQFTPAALPAQPVFLFVGRLLRAKGVSDFIAAARAVRAAFPQAAFRIVGYFDGGPNDTDRTELEAAQRDGTVTFAGKVRDTREEIARASVFVLPSYYREGVPRSALEAMAMGRPVITTDAIGCRETVRPGETGFLVPPRDPAALSAAMQRFLADPPLIARMGAASRRYVEERFDARRINATIRAALTPG